jgi:hypothetical protein
MRRAWLAPHPIDDYDIRRCQAPFPAQGNVPRLARPMSRPISARQIFVGRRLCVALGRLQRSSGNSPFHQGAACIYFRGNETFLDRNSSMSCRVGALRAETPVLRFCKLPDQQWSGIFASAQRASLSKRSGTERLGRATSTPPPSPDAGLFMMSSPRGASLHQKRPGPQGPGKTQKITWERSVGAGCADFPIVELAPTRSVPIPCKDRPIRNVEALPESLGAPFDLDRAWGRRGRRL